MFPAGSLPLLVRKPPNKKSTDTSLAGQLLSLCASSAATSNKNISLGLSRRPSFILTVLGAPIRLRIKLTNSRFTEGCADSWASLMPQTVKNTTAMWETWVRSLGWESPLEEGMVTHSGILPWRIQWTEEPCGPQSMGS